MLASDIEEGRNISIIVDKLSFDSQISIMREQYILIELILVDGKIVNFPPGIKTDLIYFDDESKLFLWENVSIKPVKFKNGMKYHKISMPSKEGTKYNRRRNYRLYIGEEMHVDVRKGVEKTAVKAVIKDVSASGFGFVDKGDYDIGQKVTLYYDAGGSKIFDFHGKIVRKKYIDNIKSNIYGCTINDTMGIMRKLVTAQQQKRLSEKNNSARARTEKR